jgi:hypothetical protein
MDDECFVCDRRREQPRDRRMYYSTQERDAYATLRLFTVSLIGASFVTIWMPYTSYVWDFFFRKYVATCKTICNWTRVTCQCHQSQADSFRWVKEKKGRAQHGKITRRGNIRRVEMVATRTLVTIPLAILHVNYLLLLLHAEVEPSGHILDGMHVAACL